MGLVMLPRRVGAPRAAQEGRAGSSQAAPSSLPIDNVGNSPKLGMTEVRAHEIQKSPSQKCCDVFPV